MSFTIRINYETNKLYYGKVFIDIHLCPKMYLILQSSTKVFLRYGVNMKNTTRYEFDLKTLVKVYRGYQKDPITGPYKRSLI